MDRASHFILDRIEDAIGANASVIDVTIVKTAPDGDAYELTVEDNRSQFPPAKPEAVAAPTRTEGALESGAGNEPISSATGGRSRYGGQATHMRLASAADHSLLCDLPATLSSVVCVNPRLDLRCQIVCGNWRRVLRVADLVRSLPTNQRVGLAVARLVFHQVDVLLGALRSQSSHSQD